MRAKREAGTDEFAERKAARDREEEGEEDARATTRDDQDAGNNGGQISDEYDNGDMDEAPLRVRVPNPKVISTSRFVCLGPRALTLNCCS